MVLTQAMKTGVIPPKIADAPQLRFGLELYYSAFMDLVTTRGGWGDSPIPFGAILDWARAAELDEVQVEDLQFYVSKLDEAYLDHVRKKAPKTGSKSTAPAPGLQPKAKK